MGHLQLPPPEKKSGFTWFFQKFGPKHQTKPNPGFDQYLLYLDPAWYHLWGLVSENVGDKSATLFKQGEKQTSRKKLYGFSPQTGTRKHTHRNGSQPEHHRLKSVGYGLVPRSIPLFYSLIEVIETNTKISCATLRWEITKSIDVSHVMIDDPTKYPNIISQLKQSSKTTLYIRISLGPN